MISSQLTPSFNHDASGENKNLALELMQAQQKSDRLADGQS